VKFLTYIKPVANIKTRSFALYGLVLALLLFALKWLEMRFVVVHHSFEIYTGLVAVIFTGLGIWLALQLAKPKTVVVEKVQVVEKTETVIVEKEIHPSPKKSFETNTAALAELGLSKRELEVLTLMARGCSNNEIAAGLFVSLNTVKTHSSKIFEKLEVKRRTQAVEKARALGILPLVPATLV
jgi:two-component system, NarL family, response regulator LiaR